MSSKLSVVIPVYNGERVISRCLDAILNQNTQRDEYEVIVVNDTSTDRTRQIVEGFPVTLINLEENVGWIRAREIGIGQSKHDLIVNLDANCIVEPDFLKGMINANYQPVLGRVLNYQNKGNIDRFFYLFRRRIRPSEYNMSEPFFLTEENFDRTGKGSGCFLCSKQLYLEASKSIGEYVGGSEDTELFLKIMEKKNIMKHPDPICYHIERDNVSDVFGQWQRRGKGAAMFYLRQSKYSSLFLGCLLTLYFTLMGSVYLKMIPHLIIIVLACLFGISLYFSEKISDLTLFIPRFMVVCLGFSIGIMKQKKNNFLSYFFLLILSLLVLTAFK